MARKKIQTNCYPGRILSADQAQNLMTPLEMTGALKQPIFGMLGFFRSFVRKPKSRVTSENKRWGRTMNSFHPRARRCQPDHMLRPTASTQNVLLKTLEIAKPAEGDVWILSDEGHSEAVLPVTTPTLARAARPLQRKRGEIPPDCSLRKCFP